MDVSSHEESKGKWELVIQCTVKQVRDWKVGFVDLPAKQ